MTDQQTQKELDKKLDKIDQEIDEFVTQKLQEGYGKEISCGDEKTLLYVFYEHRAGVIQKEEGIQKGTEEESMALLKEILQQD